MAEIRKTPEITGNSRLAELVEQYDTLIDELSPHNATVVWKASTDDFPNSVQLDISNAYGAGSRLLTVENLIDSDGMLGRVSRLVGDLVYQQSENLHDTNTLAHLASFMPGRLCYRFMEDDPDIPLPSGEDTSCAVLFADISGFTSLTERLAKKGAVGAEELTAALNSYFGELIGIVGRFGGDVLKFAGDALLATFEDRVAGQDLQDAAARAVSASLVIQRQMEDFPEVEGQKLSLKIALAAGDLRLMHLGGVFGRCELLMVGDSLKELGDANDLAGPGDIIAADSFWRRVNSLATGTPIEGGNHRIHSVSRETEEFETDGESGQLTLTNAPFRLSSIAAMRGYIPAAVFARLMAGQTDWLGELRKVTVVFGNLPGFNLKTPVREAQRVMSVLQRTMYRFEGSLNKLSVDDKGVSMLAGFGLPPIAHEDDAARAIGAALELRERISELGWKCSIGVATGRIFCGAYGNEQRREYTMIGDTVNTSARLMQAARGGILCEQSTWQGAKSRFDFDTLEPMKMKGKSEPVPCYRPLELRARTRQRSAHEITIIGRDAEQQLFAKLLDDLGEHQQSSVMLLEGEAGSGKSHLVNAFTQRAEAAGCRVLHGQADAIERSTPWYPWRTVIADIVGLAELGRDHNVLSQAICEQFKLDDEFQKLLPLLSSILPVTWPDNEWTAQMKGAIRADNTNRLLVQLIALTAQNAPLVIALDDTHDFDSASLKLLRSVSTKVEPLHILVAARPLTQPLTRPLARAAAAIMELPTSHLIPLEPMDPEDSVRMARHLLKVEYLPKPVEQLVRNRGQGLPLYVEELAITLRDTGTIEVSDGTARLTGDLDQFELREVSESLERVIVNRVDRLQPSEQLALKVASVVGFEFSHLALRDVFPIEHERDALQEHLESLDSSRLIRRIENRTELEYAFRNRTIREVTYNLVLVKHRTELHAAIAAWIEKHYAGELDAHYPRLATHWRRAGEPARAIDYLERAGENALENNANQEAVRFYRRALELEAELDQRVEPLRRGKWQRRYAEALYRLGDMNGSLKQFREAVCLFGHPDSETPVSTVCHGGVEMARQLFNRIRVGLVGKPVGRPGEALIEAVRAYERLFEINYIRNDMPATLVATFRALRLAERYGSSPELARCYSNMSAMTSAMMLRKAAYRYAGRARSIAAKSDDRPATAYVDTINSLAYISHGDWEQARKTLDTGITLCHEIGDRRRWIEANALILNMSLWSGDWSRLSEHAENIRDAGETDQSLQVALWGHAWVLWIATTSDPFSDTVRSAETSLERWLDTDEELAIADVVHARGSLLFARLRRSEWDEALAIADQIEAAIGNAQPVAVYMLEAYATMSNLYYVLCQSGRTPGNSTCQDLHRRLVRMKRRLTVFSMTIPIATPVKTLCAGRLHLLKGRTAKARRVFRKGLRQCEHFRIPYFAATFELELAKHAESEAERAELHASAMKRFHGLGIETPEISLQQPATVES